MHTARKWTNPAFAFAALVLIVGCQAGDGGDGGTTTPLSPDSTTVIATSPLETSEACPAGGVHVNWGIDRNDNGTLDPDEITGGGDICNGTSGAAGTDGVSMLLRTSAASTEACPGGGGVIEAGLDAAPFNNVLDDAEVNPSLTATICNGEAGAGGLTTLVEVQDELSGDNCSAGGVAIRSGLDTDRDGSLAGEAGVTTQYICDGPTGSIGADGDTVLLRTSAASAEACPGGGVVIEAGLDASPFNGALDDAEVNASLTATICNGQTGASGLTSLVDVQDELPGDNCSAGGVAILSGLDTDRDGSLAGETGLTPAYVCDGPAGLDGSDGASTRIISTPFSGDTTTCTASGSGLELTIWLDLNGNGLADDGNETHATLCNGLDGSAGSDGFDALVVTAVEPPGANCAFGGLAITSGQDTDGDGSLIGEPGAVTSYVCHMGGMPLVQVPDWQMPWYSHAMPSVGPSTWDRIDGMDVEMAWITAGQPTYFYDALLLTNRTAASEAVDVALAWSTGGSLQSGMARPWIPARIRALVTEDVIVVGGTDGTATLYGYPFNPLEPLANVLDWSDGYNGATTANLLSFSLAPDESVVLVPSPRDPYNALGYTLHIASSTALDASAVPSGTPLLHAETALLDLPQRYKLSGLDPDTTYQAIVTSPNTGDDAAVLSHAGPFAPAFCGYASNPGDGSFSFNACAVQADSAGRAWLEVQGRASNGPYELQVRVPPLTDGGGDPPTLTVGSGHVGSVAPAESAYYYAYPVPADTLIKVSLTELYPTGAAAVDVSDDMESASASCQAAPEDTLLECTLRTGSQTSALYIDTFENAGYPAGGIEYTITVTPAAEGSPGAPFVLTQEAIQNSSVDTTASYYQVAMWQTYSAWMAVDLSGIAYGAGSTLSVTMSTNLDAPVTCPIAEPPDVPACDIYVTVGAPYLYITVDGSGTTYGATYSITAYEELF